METWLASFLASTFLFLALSRVRFYIRFTYRRKAGDDQLRVEVYSPGRVVAYVLEVPVIRLAERGDLPWLESTLRTPRGKASTRAGAERRFVRTTWHIYRHHPRHWRYLVDQIRYFRRMYMRLAGRLLAAMTCEKLIWRTGFGAADAALTGVSAGAVWAAKGQVHKYMKRRLAAVARPVFAVTPLYGRTALEVELECIFSIRVGNVINALASTIQLTGKGANKQWVNTRSKTL